MLKYILAIVNYMIKLLYMNDNSLNVELSISTVSILHEWVLQRKSKQLDLHRTVRS